MPYDDKQIDAYLGQVELLETKLRLLIQSNPSADSTALNREIDELFNNKLRGVKAEIKNDRNYPAQFDQSFKFIHEKLAMGVAEILSKVGGVVPPEINVHLQTMAGLAGADVPSISVSGPEEESRFGSMKKKVREKKNDVKGLFADWKPARSRSTSPVEGGSSSSTRPRSASTGSSSRSDDGTNKDKMQRYENVTAFFEAMAGKMAQGNFCSEVGIFRLAGSETEIKKGIEDIKKGKFKFEDYTDPHVLVNIMKRIMRNPSDTVGIENLPNMELGSENAIQDWVSNENVTEYHCRMLGAFVSIMPYVLGAQGVHSKNEQYTVETLGTVVNPAIQIFVGDDKVNLKMFAGATGNENLAGYLKGAAADYCRTKEPVPETLKNPPVGEDEKKSRFGSWGRGKNK